jgi:hypothetical protein
MPPAGFFNKHLLSFQVAKYIVDRVSFGQYSVTFQALCSYLEAAAAPLRFGVISVV